MPIVFGAIAAAGAVSSFLGGIFGGNARKNAQYQAAAIQDQQATFTGDQARESFRRFQLQADQTVGEAKARVGASGFALTPGNSMSKYTSALADELGLEGKWMLSAGLRTADFQRQAANLQRSGADAGLVGDILSGLGGTVGQLGNVANTAFGPGYGAGGGTSTAMPTAFPKLSYG